MKIIFPNKDHESFKKYEWWIMGGKIADISRPFHKAVFNEGKVLYFQVIKKVADWLKDNNIEYEIGFRYIENRNEEWSIIFKNVSDAILFKLTWL